MRDGWDVALVACDAMVPDPQTTWKSAPSFRTNILPVQEDPDEPGRLIGYKANREHRGAPYYEQYRRTRDRLKADGCHVVIAPELMWDEPCADCVEFVRLASVRGPNPNCLACSGTGIIHTTKPSGLYAEADDVIGWLVWQYRDAAESAISHGADPEQWALRIVSSDYDLLQCVDDMIGVDVLSPHTGKVMRADDVIAKFGVSPDKVPHFKALAGDKSDGYQPFPGPRGENGKRGPGIGPESAKELLAKFNSDALAVVRAACSDVPPGDMKPNTIALLRRGGVAAAEKGLALAQLRVSLPGLDFAPILAGPAPVQRITKGPIDPESAGDAWGDDPLLHGERVVGDAFLDGREAVHTPGADVMPNVTAYMQKTQADPVPVVPPNSKTTGQDTGKGAQPHGAQQSDATAIGVSPMRASAGPSPSPAVVVPAREGAADGRAQRVEIVERKALVPGGRDERFELSPFGLEPQNIKMAYWMAERIAEARIFPKFGTPDQVLTVVLMGRARGFPALVSLENAYIIGGQVAWKSAFIAGTPMASGHAAYLSIVETDEKKALAITKRIRGGHDKEQRLSFTIDQASKLGYLDPPKEGKQPGPWHKQPEVMLRWRALVSLARMAYYDVVGGMFSPDEFRADGTATDEEL
jgi:hypothetical protein